MHTIDLRSDRIITHKPPLTERHESTIATFIGETFTLKIFDGTIEVPNDALLLREQVYISEWKILEPENLQTADDTRGIHVLIYENATGKLAGCTHMLEAEQSAFVEQSGLKIDDLCNAVLSSRSTVSKEFRSKGIFQFLVYTATRYYRMSGRNIVVSYLEDNDHPTHKRFKMDMIPHGRKRVEPLTSGKLLSLSPYATSVNYAMYRGSLDLNTDLQDIMSQLVIDEIKVTIRRQATDINDTSLWCKARSGTLTKNQYCEFLSELYNFVKFTTRIIALAVAQTEDKPLRRHFMKHLREEVDHEVILENDLKALGADTEYLLVHKSPSKYIHNFNGLQESLLGWRKDPVNYMAVPFAVEGISAFMSPENLTALRVCIRSWGVENPDRGMAFLSSHKDFDGQDGGHWEMTLDAIKPYITSEKNLSRFLTIGTAIIENLRSMIEDKTNDHDPVTWTQAPIRSGATQHVLQ